MNRVVARPWSRALVLVVVVLSGACADDRSTATGRGGGEGFGTVTVFAASSLTESFTELGERLESHRPGTSVVLNFASSSDLALQITEGAPADVFASADTLQMAVVEDAGLARNPMLFATNELVVIVPSDDPARIETPRDVAKSGVKLVLPAPEVPAGNYARRAFDALGIADAAEANVVSNEDDVKAVVTKVALGEADAGVVYVTDATTEVRDSIEVIPFPPQVDVLAEYPIATLEDAPNPRGAGAFIDLTLSREGRRLLAAYGFGAP
ncbi:MAG: molybdate ABC transporter substrate-binding protein [Actinomycetota bacterium]